MKTEPSSNIPAAASPILAEVARRYLKAMQTPRLRAACVPVTQSVAARPVLKSMPAAPASRSFPEGSLRLSFIVVIHNERAAVMDLYTRIALASAARDLRFEIIFVDKGSKDGTWEEISRLCYGDSRLHGTRVRPETSEAQAVASGFRVSSGDLLFTLNAGYDNVANLSHFMQKMDEGYDYVCGVTSAEHSIRFGRAFLNWASRHTGVHLGHFRAGYKCYNARMIRNMSRMLKMKDCSAAMALISRVHGCRAVEIVMEPLKPLPVRSLANHPVAKHLRTNAVSYLVVLGVLLMGMALWMCSVNGGISIPSVLSLHMALMSALGALYASGFSAAAQLARLALPARFSHKPKPVAAAIVEPASIAASARLVARFNPASTVSLGVPTIMTTMTAQPVPARADHWVFPDHMMPSRRRTCALPRYTGSRSITPSAASTSSTPGSLTVIQAREQQQQLKPMVLIADDDSAIRHVMRIHMEMNGFRVIEAANGAQVMSQLEQCPDLVLLDLMMPGVNGDECLREIHRRAPATRVIIVSGRIDVEENKTEMDAFEFISKPVDFQSLLVAVNRAMHSSPA